ncbi:AraC family transcriptional regulator [Paenibacillus polymyxa]|uniref:AraC family transcriptional regulator n=1 Tax=Paenibacillus polymyxa TaxID=1406 RepID=UPI002AB4BC97|nr:AraC family transcriptional regulator [Paenibacillus polymyxa]MDY8023763.1 AraC family transcriptional regulator [Paenibacillus polymyxa]
MILNPDVDPALFHDCQWLPIIDWNVKFFGAHIHRVQADWCMPEESHIGFEIALILEGRQETIMENNVYSVGEGDILIIPPGFKHVSQCVSPNGMYYFSSHFNVDDPVFRQEMIKNNQLFFPAGTETNTKLQKVVHSWIGMVQESGEYTTADRFRMQIALFELFGIFSQMISTGLEPTISPSSVQYAKAIMEAIQSRFKPYREDESGEQAFRLEDVAASLGISPGYAQEVFRKVYGYSPRHYLSETKLHEAKVLIQQPNLPLNKIASLLGYSSLAHFSRQFKRWTGTSPLKYRQTLKPITDEQRIKI